MPTKPKKKYCNCQKGSDSVGHIHNSDCAIYKKKEVKLNRYERAILVLARHIEECPFNGYKVREQVLNELGLEFVPSTNPN